MIDADTHVVEGEWTWDSLPAADRHFRPLALATSGRDGPPEGYWLVGGQKLRRRLASNPAYPKGVCDLSDVAARVAEMDRLAVAVQVLFPTFFLNSHIKRPELELALCKAYNRWMGEVCLASNGRLRWAMVLPFHSIEHSLSEMDQARKNGGCAVLMRGAEHDRVLSDPYFFPVYEKAQALDIPIAVHVGNAVPTLNEVVEKQTIIFDIFPVAAAMYSLLVDQVSARFPGLRFAFLESGSQWIPFVLQEATRLPGLGGRRQSRDTSVLRNNRFFVACQTDDDLPYILSHGAEDNLVFGTDYGHEDVGSDLGGHRILSERDDVPSTVLGKIVSANARALYAL